MNRLFDRCNNTIFALIILLGLFVGTRIVTAFTSGRVAQILHGYRDVHHCAQIGDPVAQGECIIATEKETK